MNKQLLFRSTDHWFSKISCSPVIFTTLLLLIYSVQATARTTRTAEAMLDKKNQAIGVQTYQTPDQAIGTSRKTEQMLTGSTQKTHLQKLNTNSTIPKQNSSSSHTPQVKQKKHSTSSGFSPNGTMLNIVNGVKLEILSCKYVPEYKSVTCDFKATNLEPDTKAVIYCYTGTEAVDETGSKLQCAHVWLESNHSWNYAHGQLMKGTPVRGMIRLETRRAPEKLKVLKVSMALNGATESTLIKNIPVR